MFTYDQIQKTEDIDLMDLGQGAINNQPQNKDWQEGYPEEWQYFDSCRSDPDYQDVKPGVLVYPADQDKVDRLHEYCEGPVMNFVIELPENWGRSHYAKFGDIDEATAQIYDLPLCIVELFEGPIEYGLALTGGGMDLSWEICEAFMRLGHLPPTHYASLPGMAGRGESEADRKIIEACIASFQAQGDRSSRGIQNLERTFA